MEIQARIADESWPGYPFVIESHRLNQALRAQ
jgi:hypothetical protein